MKSSPPLFFSYNSADEYFSVASQVLSPEEISNGKELARKNLPPVTSIASLSILTGFSSRFVGSMVREPHQYYRQFLLRKRNGSRTISAPYVCIKVIQKWLSYHWSRSHNWCRPVHGFVPGRSIISAAKTHCPSKSLAACDLADFFGSVNLAMTRQSILDLGYTGVAVKHLADLCILNGSLPQGAPTSPVLANLAFEQTDIALSDECENKGLRYTRYADDIAISSPDRVAEDRFVFVAEVISRAGWRINDEKTRFYGGARSPRVLGLLVESDHPRLSRKYRRRLRAMRHRFSRTSQADERKMRVLSGHNAFASSIENFA